MEIKDSAVIEILALASKCVSGKLTDAQLRHVREVCIALAEDTKSVHVNRSLLEIIWPESERYLGSVKNGRLVVLINSTYERNQKLVERFLVSSGIPKARIHFEKADSKSFDPEEMVKDRNNKACLYMKDVSNQVVEHLPKETSVSLRSLRRDHVRRGVEELRKKLI